MRECTQAALIFLSVLSLVNFSSVFAFGGSFAETIQAELTYSELCSNTPFISKIAQKHVVFVDGFLNEIANITRANFTDNINALKELGVSSSHLSFSSREAIPANAGRLAERLREIHALTGRPLILIAHSKGGAEALYAVLNEPDLLISEIVERVVLITAAIGGSPIVDRIHNLYFGKWIRPVLGEGWYSMSTGQAQENFAEVFRAFQAKVKMQYGRHGDLHLQSVMNELSSRVFYVRSSLPPSEYLSLGLSPTLVFCRNTLGCRGEHDGLLKTQDQLLGGVPTFGVDLGILPGDHMEWVVAGFLSRSRSESRKAFTRAILRHIYPDLER